MGIGLRVIMSLKVGSGIIEEPAYDRDNNLTVAEVPPVYARQVFSFSLSLSLSLLFFFLCFFFFSFLSFFWYGSEGEVWNYRGTRVRWR